MSHYCALRAIVIDVPEDDHDRELAFWQGAIGEELHGDEQGPDPVDDFHRRRPMGTPGHARPGAGRR